VPNPFFKGGVILKIMETERLILRTLKMDDIENNASQKVLEKLGFTYAGMKWCEETNQDEPYFEMILS
jgi:[ribosomal protein S5]-alanine N-acetyltransferase